MVFADLTGTWAGTYSATATACNPPQSTSGNLSLWLTQSGSNVSGTLVVEVKLVNCQPQTPALPVGVPVSGSVSGNTWTFQFVLDIPGGPLGGGGSATISGNTMSVTFSGGDTNGTATLTQTSTAPPDSGLSGTYSGPWNGVLIPCGKLAPVNQSGTLTGSLTQSGNSLSGLFTGTGFKIDHQDASGTCTVTDDPDPRAFFTAQISGSTVTGVILSGGSSANVFFGQISGSTISGHVTGDFPGEFIDFTLSRTSSALPPAIVRFEAVPPSISSGQSATLSWSTLNASVSIDNGIGAQPAVGSVSVKPNATTTYTLTASGGGTSVTATATVTVGAGAAPAVAVSSFPRGMVQVAGQGGANDSFALTNTGPVSTDLTLSASGNFFTITPTSFSLAGGATRVVTVTGTAQAANSYSGSVTVNGNGASGLTVPIRLLSATPPTGTVVAQAAVSRSDVSAPAGQNPTGSVNFTNSGTSVLQGIAVSDVPWIIPQSGVITIQPGQTQAITFTIDSSRRPDASSPLGGVIGKISLIFISGPASKTALANTPTSSVSVTVVYVVTPGVAPGTPPPLAANELALFVPGLANKPKAIGDLLISSKQSSGPLTDLKLYFQSSGGSLLTSLPSILPNAIVALPGLLKNVFTTSADSGTAQLRGGDLSKVAVSAMQFNTSNSAGTFGTALPIFRSDRGLTAGGQMVISGVTRESGMQTDLYLQEVSGNPASFTVEFIGSTGVVSTNRQSGSLAAFGSFTVSDSLIPESTAALRITASGAGKINAYALVQDLNSGDAWVISDPAVNAFPNDDTYFVPVLRAGSGAQTSYYATNRTASQASVTVDLHSAGLRRRAVPHSIGAPRAANTVTLAPYASLVMPSVDSTVSYIRFVSAAGAVSVNARSLRTSGANTFGSGLPALPASAAIGSGDLKRFAGVEDAAVRTNLVLIEAAGQGVTVKVTLRYAFVAGSTVAASAVSSKEYSVSGSQMLVIGDVARDVIGSVRGSFGDLHNMELDVEVSGGAGRVLPFLQAVDSGSGDTVVRTE